MKKRHKLRNTLLLLLVVVVGLWWYGTFTLQVDTVTIKSEKIHDDITIVQLTDLHGSSFGKDNRQLIKKIEGQKPDLILITGDMYTSTKPQGKETALSLMAQLAKKYPVYFVNGEHDNKTEFKNRLEEAGVHVLDYEMAPLEIGSTKLCLYGIDTLYYTPTFDLTTEFTLQPDRFNILMAHIENFDAFVHFGADLSVCGDTHGGQARLPVIGALYHQGTWFPKFQLGAYYDKGLFEKDGHYLFVSSGLGNFPIPIRTFNRPQVAVIKLSPAS